MTTRVAVKTSGRTYVVDVDTIDWAEAAGNYVRLHVGAQAHLFRESITALEKRLDPQRFARIHRSTIVNVERIAWLDPTFGREYVVTLRDGTRLRVGASFRASLHRLIAGL